MIIMLQVALEYKAKEQLIQAVELCYNTIFGTVEFMSL